MAPEPAARNRGPTTGPMVLSQPNCPLFAPLFLRSDVSLFLKSDIETSIDRLEFGHQKKSDIDFKSNVSLIFSFWETSDLRSDFLWKCQI